MKISIQNIMDAATFSIHKRPEDHYLAILWLVANGKWDAAHKLADSRSDKDSAWLHAYLHRVEGDDWNARYWYNRAGRPFPSLSLEEEWRELYLFFCQQIMPKE